MNENILLIEDEEALRLTLGDRLRREGFHVEESSDGEDGLDKATRLPHDLIILDLMLPYRSGLDICRDIRQTGVATPILVLSARSETVDKVIGLKLGADDYVTKPFEAVELLARIEALLRRVPTRAGKGTHQFGSVRIDLRRGLVTRDGHPVYLSARELQLLRYLIERAGEVVPRTDLLRSVWGYDSRTFTRTVDVHVSSLRHKLENDPKRPEMIVTVSGVGYQFLADSAFFPEP
ncbi:MAG TPA: response regulator transcription factor [Acidobacteriaceae bacterium]|jgi:two-component system alkaline phosphatase synthesis response regulator PhoP|nr:response regulator transcription factor [Acidobacteriaceae bacterium]